VTDGTHAKAGRLSVGSSGVALAEGSTLEAGTDVSVPAEAMGEPLEPAELGDGLPVVQPTSAMPAMRTSAPRMRRDGCVRVMVMLHS
jgi:hypothetical protein